MGCDLVINKKISLLWPLTKIIILGSSSLKIPNILRVKAAINFFSFFVSPIEVVLIRVGKSCAFGLVIFFPHYLDANSIIYHCLLAHVEKVGFLKD